MKTLVQITAQCSENYGSPESPAWKFKGGQIFNLYADSYLFMYGEEHCVSAIQKLLASESNAMWRYEYVSHELIFSDPIVLDSDLFESEFESIVAK